MKIFQLTEANPRPGCREIRIEGELDLAVAPQLEEAIDRAEDGKSVLLNLEACEFIDSTGIAVIVNTHHRLKEQGRGLVVYGVDGQVLRVLSISGLVENGLVFRSAEEAQLQSPR
jgi:stage II sporulation protein AA (anti-sigma F factor antagonist)